MEDDGPQDGRRGDSEAVPPEDGEEAHGDKGDAGADNNDDWQQRLSSVNAASTFLDAPESTFSDNDVKQQLLECGVYVQTPTVPEGREDSGEIRREPSQTDTLRNTRVSVAQTPSDLGFMGPSTVVEGVISSEPDEIQVQVKDAGPAQDADGGSGTAAGRKKAWREKRKQSGASELSVPLRRRFHKHGSRSGPLHEFDSVAKRVLFPDNKLLLYWDLFILLQIVFIVLYVPFQVGVSDGALVYASQSYAFLFATFINFSFIIDVGLNFFRAYYDSRGLLVFNHRRVVRHYLMGWFIVDLVACIPVDLLNWLYPSTFREGPNSNILSVVNLLRIFRVNRAYKIVHNNSRLLDFHMRTFAYSTEMLRIVLTLMVVGHWMACAFSFVALIETEDFSEDSIMDPDRNSWLQAYVANGGPIPVLGNSFDAIWGRYTLSLYWAVTTTTSIGYGDITPITLEETWFVIIAELFAGLLWAWVLGQVINIVEEIGKDNNEYRGRLVAFNQLEAAWQGKDRELGTSCRAFLLRQHTMSTGRSGGTQISQISSVLEKLPPRLRNRVCLQLVEKDLKQVSYFRHPNIDINTLAGIASLSEIHQYDTGEVIIVERSAPRTRRGLYILRTGVIATTHGLAGSKGAKFNVHCVSGVIMHDHVLLPGGSKALPEVLTMAFLTYTEMVFIPRSAIKALFEVHPRVWREVGRWCAVRCSLGTWSREAAQLSPAAETPDDLVEKVLQRRRSHNAVAQSVHRFSRDSLRRFDSG